MTSKLAVEFMQPCMSVCSKGYLGTLFFTADVPQRSPI